MGPRFFSQHQHEAIRLAERGALVAYLIARIVRPPQHVALAGDLQSMSFEVLDREALFDAMQSGRSRIAASSLRRVIDQQQDSAGLQRARQLIEHGTGVYLRPDTFR